MIAAMKTVLEIRSGAMSPTVVAALNLVCSSIIQFFLTISLYGATLVLVQYLSFEFEEVWCLTICF